MPWKTWHDSENCRERCYRLHNVCDENCKELSRCHGASGCCVCLCVFGPALWSGAAISRQTTGEISKLCLPSFAQLRQNLIFTACLAHRHNSQAGGTAQLVHWASEIRTHACFLSSSQLPPYPISHPSTLNLTQGQPLRHTKTHTKFGADYSGYKKNKTGLLQTLIRQSLRVGGLLSHSNNNQPAITTDTSSVALKYIVAPPKPSTPTAIFRAWLP